MNELSPFIKRWNPAVKLIDQYPIYELGGSLRNLKETCDQQKPVGYEQMFALWDAKHNLERLLSGEMFLISYCKDAAEDLHANILHHIQHFEREDGSAQTDPPIEPWQMSMLKEKVTVFEHQFSAEVKKIATYAVPKRGIFDTEQLAEQADEHLPPTVRHFMQQLEVSEIQQSGRCLAFGLYTASGFHSMRAVEVLLRKYYNHFVAPPKKSHPTMGVMAGELEKRTDDNGGPNKSTVRLLKDATTFDRNPVMHPNATLDEDDASMLFQRAHAIIVSIVKELVAEQQSNPSPVKTPPPSKKTTVSTAT